MSLISMVVSLGLEIFLGLPVYFYIADSEMPGRKTLECLDLISIERDWVWDAKSYGGCGCLILHEVLHALGLKADEEEYNAKNYRRDEAMIKLANELLKASKEFHCKGYGIK